MTSVLPPVTSSCPTLCTVAATMARKPLPTRVKEKDPAHTVSCNTAINPSLTSGAKDREVQSQFSIEVGPIETLEVDSLVRPPIRVEKRVEKPVPKQIAATQGPTQDKAEAIPATESACCVVWDPVSSQTVSDAKLAAWSDNQAGRVILDVGGTQFVTSKATLFMEPSSLLAQMVREGSSMKPLKTDELGSPMYFLDRDPAHFSYILNYLRLGNQWSSHCLPNVLRDLYDLLAETEHFQLQGIHDHINNRITNIKNNHWYDCQ